MKDIQLDLIDVYAQKVLPNMVKGLKQAIQDD